MATKFSPGFRLSALDILILAVGAAASAALASFDARFAVAIAFVVAHFFLFCNVLRMSRPLELLWSLAFLVLALAALTFHAIPWPAALAASCAMTLLVAAIEMRRPSYHGAGWQTLNPRLPEWWAAAHSRGPS